MDNTTNIPKENLCFFFGTIRKKSESEYNTNKSYIANFVPFNSEIINNANDKEKWERLTQVSVNWLKDKKELPSFAQEQDYERISSCGFCSLGFLNQLADELDTEEVEEQKEIVLFNNAFDKIILPQDYKQKIIETISQLKESKLIFEEWGLGEKLKKGTGINMLFSGESGTGKTYCGEIIAEYLGTECKIVTSAEIEDMYVGNSEKNVKNIFASLKGNNKVLIIDEADSFLSCRADNNQHHENKLVNQLLVELERHNGICILTTNRAIKLDRALQRRIDLSLEFPSPNKNLRKQIWEYMIPTKLPKEHIDYDVLSDYVVNGGIIKNSLLTAIRKMVSSNEKILTMEILKQSIENELKEISLIKNGKDFSKN